MPLFAVSAAVLLLTAPHARAAGDARMGRVLAEYWCVNCHATSKSQSASDSAPPLAREMRRTGRSDEALRAWLANPHAPMPNLSLTRGEIDDLVAYLATLRSR